MNFAPLITVAGILAASLAILALGHLRDLLVPLISAGLVLGSSTLPGTEWMFVLKFALLALLSLLFLIPTLGRRARQPQPVGFQILFALLVMLAFASTLHSVSPETTLAHAASLFLLWLAVAISLPRLLLHPRQLGNWLLGIGVVAGASVIAGLILAMAGVVEGFEGERFSGLFVDPNTLGYLVAPVFPGLVLVSSRETAPKKALHLGSVVLVAAGLALTGSRAGILSPALGLLSAIWLARRSGQLRLRRRAWALALVGVGAVVILLFSLSRPIRPPGPEGFITDLGTGSLRTVAWDRGVELIGQDPWTGTGFATTVELFPAHDLGGGITFSHLHNSYLEAGLDMGLPAVVLLGLLILMGLRASWRLSYRPGATRWVGPVLFGGIVGGAVEAVFESGLLSPGGLLAFHFWLVVAVACTLDARNRSGRESLVREPVSRVASG